VITFMASVITCPRNGQQSLPTLDRACGDGHQQRCLELNGRFGEGLFSAVRDRRDLLLRVRMGATTQIIEDREPTIPSTIVAIHCDHVCWIANIRDAGFLLP
jgi:hypothetical protein